MTYPTKPEAMAMLEAWQAQHERIEAVMASIQPVFGRIVDAPIFNVSRESFDLYTKTLELLLGSGDWLAWYSAENEFGARKMQAGYDGKLKKITCFADLYRLIEMGRARG